MNSEISPKYQMRLVNEVEGAIWQEYKSYKEVHNYISKWHEHDGDDWDNYWENFNIKGKKDDNIDLNATLHGMDGELLLKVAIDMGIETPDYIPSIPTFKNELKADFKTAYSTFSKAMKSTADDPSTSIGLANSTLESIIKQILKDDKISAKVNSKQTLYKLATAILKEFKLIGNDVPKEIKTIGTSLLTISQSIEKLRSEKTEFHGKTDEDYLIEESLYAQLVVNAVTSVGLFLLSYYKTKYPKEVEEEGIEEDKYDDLPF